MPVPAYVWFDDANIKGSVEIAGREGTSEIMEFTHNLNIPTDPHSGALTGIRMHSPVTLVKPFDAASPYLYKACCEGETLPTVTIRWYMIDDTGTEVNYFTHLLENVKISAMHASMPNTKDPAKAQFVHLEEVSMVYSKITWTFEDGTLEYTDAWKEAK